MSTRASDIRCEIAIVGGGIVGAACAAEFAAEGCRVVVLERGIAAGEATSAGMGHLVVLDDSPAQLALTVYARRLWHALLPQLPADAEVDVCGTLWVAESDEEMALVERKRDVLAGGGVAAEVLAVDELRRAEPQLRAGLAGGLRVPDDAVIYPPTVTRLLLARAADAGAQLRTRVAVRHVEGDGRVHLADGSRVQADLVLNAAGTGAPALSPAAPIRPRKGHLVITDRYPGWVHHQLIELGYLRSTQAAAGESVAFNIQPRRTGQLLIGSSRQFDAETSDVEMRVVAKMVQRAREYLPGVEALSALRIWTGFRAATPDKLPLIGPSPEQPRVWLAAGHEGLGITTCLATARLLRDRWRGHASEIDAAPYLPQRFTAAGGSLA
ncbi:MAG: FAD-binding oxidoreductase [Pirellulaceae bacterium]|nr:FAD-binding oxidoreductase [Pirellulaceae bacterium]